MSAAINRPLKNWLRNTAKNPKRLLVEVKGAVVEFKSEIRTQSA